MAMRVFYSGTLDPNDSLADYNKMGLFREKNPILEPFPFDPTVKGLSFLKLSLVEEQKLSSKIRL